MADWSNFDKKGNAFEEEGYTDNTSIFSAWEQTQGYYDPIGMHAKTIEEQAKRDQEWQIGKSAYNGVAGVVRGTLGAGKMLNDLYAERATENGYVQNKDDLMLGWNSLINSSALQRYETGNNFVNNLVEGAGQLAIQAGVTAATGGTGGMLFMGAQIAGGQYLDLTDEGVDTKRAATASTINAIVQMPMERFGFSKILGGNKNPLKRALKDRLLDVGEAMLSEGFTESIQELPEQLTNIWAKNPGITLQGIGAEWDKNAEDNIKSMGYSGVIGGILGGGGASVRVAIDSRGEKYLQDLHKGMQRELDNRIEANKIEGRTPEQITEETNANLVGHEIAIEAKPLLEFMQTKNPTDVANTLGVTVDQVQKAAADGLDIVVPQGNYEGAAAKYEGFRDKTRDYTSFDEGDYSVNAYKQKRALAKEAKLAADEQEKIDIHLRSIAQEMANAGVPLSQRVGMMDILSRFASREAAGLGIKTSDWMERNPIEWKGDGKGSGFLNFKQNIDITQNENFRNWFGNSKVIGADGKPLVMYHGTGTPGIEVFDKKKAQDKAGRTMAMGQGKGKFYFATTEVGAKNAAEGAVYRGRGKTPTVMPVYLSMQNPVSLEEYKRRYQELSGHDLNEGYEGDYTQKVRDSFIAKLDKALQTEGIDGIYDPAAGFAAVYNSTQIKSVDNNGQFTGDNPNIFYQEALSQAEGIRQQYQGTEQWLKAPNGKQTNLTEDEWCIVRTASFKRWFGDWENRRNTSQVLDANGEPKVVYHGTNAYEIKKFKTGKSGYLGGAIYTTDTKSYAERYTDYGSVYDLFINIKNPLVIEGGDEPARKVLQAIYGEDKGKSLYEKRMAKQERETGIISKADIKKLKDLGYDGIDWVVSDTHEYAVYDANQLKSATGNNGEFDPNNTNIFYQQSNKDLVVYQNTNIEGLTNAIEGGGMSVPSMAVTKKDIPFDNFGEITLIGTKDIIDPEQGNDVYSRDAYTVRTPHAVYRDATNKVIKAFRDKWQSRLGDDIVRDIVYEAANYPNMFDDHIKGNAKLQYYYLTKVLGVDFKPVNQAPEYHWKINQLNHGAVGRIVEAIVKKNLSRDEELREMVNVYREALAAEIRPYKEQIDLIDKTLPNIEKRLQEEIPDGERAELEDKKQKRIHKKKLNEVLIQQITKNYSDKITKDSNGNEIAYLGPASVLLDDARKVIKIRENGTEIDWNETKEEMSDKYGHNLAKTDYAKFLSDIKKDALGDPVLKVGSKYVPYTAENITAWMLKQRGRGKEQSWDTMTTSKMAAMASKLFSSIQDIRDNKDLLKTKEEVDALIEQLDAKRLSVLRHLLDYDEDEDIYFDQEVGFNEILAKCVKGGGKITPAKVKKALASDFTDVDPKVINEIIDVCNAYRDCATWYFEAKPQRTVGINEYAGAVVPRIESEKMRRLKENLAANGVQVREYDPSVPGDRQRVTEELAAETNAYFQKGEQVKGAFTPGGDGANIIRLFKGHDASTVIHETGHYFFEMFMQDSAMDQASDQMRADREAFLKYGECTEERWAYLHDGHPLNDVEFDELTAIHERIAEAFETYFIEGKAPSRELRSLFRRFSSWLKSIYGIIRDGEWGNRNENAIAINDEVRQAFDHWLASQEEIEAVARIDGYFAKLPKGVVDNLSDSIKDRLAEFAEGAKDKAIEIMVKKSMVNFTAERRAAIAQYKKDARPVVEAEIDELPLYTAIEKLHTYEGWKHANAKVLARKYTDSAAMVYTEYKDLKNRADAGISDIIDPIVAQMEAGIDNEPKRTYWINKETGMEEDVSDLERDKAEELTSGRVYEKFTEPDMSAPWYIRYKDLYGKRISKKKIRELAIDAALGHDTLGIFDEFTNGMNAEQLAEFREEMAAQAEELKAMLEIQQDMEVEGWFAKHYKSFALEPEQRIYFEAVAEDAGYDSGDAFAKAILESPSRAQAINQRIKQYVDERYPDIQKERAAAEQAAREAMYNEESEELLALESQIVYWKALKMENYQMAAAGRAAQVAALKAQVALAAKAEIARMPLGEAKQTRSFVRAERRAAAHAAEAMKAGDYETAYAYKQQQMLNHAMARESIKIRQEITKSVKFLRKLRTRKRETWGNEQHLGQAGALMARMGITAKAYNPTMHTEPLAQYLQEMQDSYGSDIVEVADWLLDESIDLSDPKAMSLAQYRDCINALKNLRQISMQDQLMHAFAKDMAVQQWKTEARANLEKLKDKYKPDPNGKQKVSWLDQYKAGMRSTDNFFEMMDGWTEGFFTKTMAVPLKHCADLERKMIMAMEKRAADAYVKWLPDVASRNAAEEKVFYKELGASVDRHTLVRLMANMGNDGNARVLCTTPPLGMQEGTIWVKPNESVTPDDAVAMTKENMVKFLGSVLTKADIDYAQSLIDNANYYWAELAQVERNSKGFAPVKVEAAPVLLTLADGSQVLFKGGYLPLVQNREGGYRPGGQDMLSLDTENQVMRSAMFTTNQGSTKKRVNANYPIDMSRGAELRSMRNTIHDIAYREIMADFRNIFNDKELYNLMLTKLGLANMRQCKEFLTVAADPYGNNTTTTGESTFTATVNWLRRKTVNAAIMLNIKTAFQNLGNITLYGNSVEGFSHQDAYNAVMKYGLQATTFRETETDRLIAEKSVFMAERDITPDITWKDAIEAMPAQWEQSLGLDKVEKGSLKWGAKLMIYTDNLTAKPVWRYAYEKKIASGASEQEAVDFADSIIRKTLGSNRAQDVSSLQRGSALFKIFTTFQGFFNVQYSQWEREFNIASRLVSEGQRKEAMKRIVLFAASKWLLNCLICVTLGMENPFEKDKDTDLLNKWGEECLSYPMSMLGPWGQGANMITKSLLGIRSYGYRMTAIQSTIERYDRVASTSRKYIEGKATGRDLLENISSVALPLIGAPDEVHKLFWNGFDYFYGDISELEIGDLVRRRPKKERK